MNRKWIVMAGVALAGATLLQGCGALVVGGAAVTAVMVSDRRTTGTYVEDETIEWKVVDSLRQRHAQLAGPTLFVWGEDDVTFPVSHAERMVEQFNGRARLVRIPHASLMPHEEKPEAVLDAMLPFLVESTR